MEQNISAKSDDKLSSVTSTNGTNSHESEKVEKEWNSQSNVEKKLQYYDSECKRYALRKIEMIQKGFREEFCNLENYAIESLQCQIMFESFARHPVSRLTSISLKNNHLEAFCCHSIALFMKSSTFLLQLILDGCK
jgi:hypothetical protein